MIADTGTMRSRIDGLQQRPADSRRELDRLRDELRRAREEGLRDALTGLANRRAFDQALAACLAAPAQPAPVSTPAATAREANAAIDAARRPSPATVPSPESGPWLLMAEIDHFRRIGTAFGPPFGDQVLTAVADAMCGFVPAGAAFALLVPELDAAGALALVERVRAHVGSAPIRDADTGDAERITLSLGVARGGVGEAPQALLERAGAALRQARGGGRDRVASA